MQTRPIDALQLWWRQINFTQSQRRGLAIIAIIALTVSAIYIFKPNNAKAITSLPELPIAEVLPPLLVVDVAGEVKAPGVYKLPPNSRVNDAIKSAGGAKKSADLSLINLARIITDGEQIYVERRYSSGFSGNNQSSNRAAVKSKEIINLNRASTRELESLSGIGPVLAARIIEYRKLHGAFNSVDELQKVPGIGASKLAKFKEKLRV